MMSPTDGSAREETSRGEIGKFKPLTSHHDVAGNQLSTTCSAAEYCYV